MASQITIGRFGLDIDTSEISVWDMGGDRVQVSGELYAPSVAAALAARQQILGLADNVDEPLVPVAWVEDTSLDGHYVVESSRVQMLQSTLTEGVLPWSMVLRRPPRNASLITDQVINGVGRDGWEFVLTPRFWVATSNGSKWSSSTGTPSSATGTRNYYDLTSVYVFDIIEHADLGDATVTNYQSYSGHYGGAAELLVDGYTVIGRQAKVDADAWVIDNKIVKVSAPADTANDLCDVEFYPPSGSDLPTVAYTLKLGYYSGSWTNRSPTIQTVTVTRNSPEEVSVRLRGSVVSIDVSVRRGDRGAVLTIAGPSAKHGVGFDSTTACTDIDGSAKGVYVTSADADANIPILVGSATVTRDTTNGRVYATNAATSFQVYAGATYTGASAPDTAVWLQEAFFAAMGETARLVTP